MIVIKLLVVSSQDESLLLALFLLLIFDDFCFVKLKLGLYDVPRLASEIVQLNELVKFYCNCARESRPNTSYKTNYLCSFAGVYVLHHMSQR